MAAVPHAKDIKLFPFVDRIAGERPPNSAGDTVEDVKRQFIEAASSARGVKIHTDTRLPWQKSKHGLLYGTKTERLAFEINLLCDWLEIRRIAESDFLSTQVDKSGTGEVKNVGTYRDRVTHSGMKMGAANRLMKLLTKYALLKEEEAFRHNLENWITGRDVIENYHLCWWLSAESRDDAEDGRDPRQGLTGETLIKEIEKLSLAKRKPGLLAVPDEADRINRRTKYFLESLAAKLPDTYEESYLWYKYLVMNRPVTVDRMGTAHYYDDSGPQWNKELVTDRQVAESIERKNRDLDQTAAKFDVAMGTLRTPSIHRGQAKGAIDPTSSPGLDDSTITYEALNSEGGKTYPKTPIPITRAPGIKRLSLAAGPRKGPPPSKQEIANAQGTPRLAKMTSPNPRITSLTAEQKSEMNARIAAIDARIAAKKAAKAATPTLARIIKKAERQEAARKKE